MRLCCRVDTEIWGELSVGRYHGFVMQRMIFGYGRVAFGKVGITGLRFVVWRFVKAEMGNLGLWKPAILKSLPFHCYATIRAMHT